jgi:GDPmannose 4,6-dehydratase
MKKTAIIIGSSGQDGRILFDYLSEKKYNLAGIDKKGVRTVGIKWKNKVNITRPNHVFKLIHHIKPDEVYYLAAFHHSSQDRPIKNEMLIRQSHEINVLGLLYFLEGIRLFSPNTRIFYAASSLLFGAPKVEHQTEMSPFCPDTIYGGTKLEGLNLCRFYRNHNNVFASVGILFNHESVYRSDKFIALKIIKTAIAIKHDKAKRLEVGNLSSAVDWGYAPDFVDAFWRILNAKKADDYIIATGQKHTVKQFIEETFKQLNLDWKKYVVEKQNILTRKKVALTGDYGKLYKATGWKPRVGFADMIKIIIKQLDV